MDYINYHVEVTPDGHSVNITAYHPDRTEAGQRQGSFGLWQVRDEVFALTEKVAQEIASRQEMERLGEKLFHALFYDSGVGEHFRSTFRHAREHGQGLRLELGFDETQMPDVAALPWEFLRAPQTSGYPVITLATDPHLVLSRRRRLWEPPPRIAKAEPLRILLAIAAPNDPELGPVVYEEVLRELRALTQQPGVGFEPLGEPLSDADLLKLDQALQSQPDILHFIGHGQFVSDPADPHGELAMVGAGGWTEWKRDDDFASVLERHVPAVVFLQACEGGALSSARGLAGVASKVVQRNVPVVVAMQYPVSNAAALVFARRFYELLAGGDPADKAAQEGRRALWYKYTGQREFVTPVLYMRAPDGRIFDIERALPSSAEQASKGLIALTEMAQSPKVRAAVVAFQTDFQAACEQIDVVSYYKDMHDLLHTLQFQCYNLIVQEARRFPTDEVSLDNLMHHELTLQGITGKLRDVADQAIFAEHETSWIRDLKEAGEELHGAIENADRKQLKKAIWILNHRVLGIRPSLINKGLIDAARALRLPALAEALSHVRDNLVHLDLESERMGRFETGVDALGSLDHKLTTFVEEHHRWQEIDNELRMIERYLGDIDQLGFFWDGMKGKAESLYGGSAEAWATSLEKYSERLESAIAAQDPAKVKTSFRQYRWQAGDRFYRVDMDLKRLCEDLRKVGESLDLLMGMIQ